MKQWRYGTPTPAHPTRVTDLVGRRFGFLVVLERIDNTWRCRCDCGAETTTRTGDLNRGTARSCGNVTAHYRRGDLTYAGAHSRVRTDLGVAADHMCAEGCGRAAYHWSYDHLDPDELREAGMPYSTKVEHYRPLCVSCHKIIDLDYLATHRA